MEIKYAARMANLRASEIREILKVTENPNIISFAGGLPAPELFPVKEIKEINRLVLEESGSKALQYSTTEGYKPLRELIAKRMNNRLLTSFDVDNILITHGSQQALDLSGKVFLDKNDVVLCESPTYLAAINSFKAYECTFAEVETDNEGMVMENLEKMLQTIPRIKFIYVIPDFQNPTGRTWSLEKRKALAKLAAKYKIIVIEDNPYGELRFEGETLPSIKSFDKEGYVLCTGTFSKIFCPGFRIAWIAGDKEIIHKYVLVKQGADLQCNTLAQMEISKYLELYNINEHINKIIDVYKRRRDLTIHIMEEKFPKTVSFTHPKGGLFIWVELPANIDAREVLAQSIQRKVAFVPGGAFFPNGGKENTLRINFSNMPEERIVEGLTILGEILYESIK
ncbi:aminotransferase-like domain-containing protein [Apibacter adventoris]|uniref:aminotransferase-like domain-containing protein n=1 Tax=Apibacter adventoris TaxID=1679466 RepID=UPI000CF6EB1E|nr:PLP-dependent aminotransferase family protein [Apibacter adventoris]PQL92525.1 aminotransferase [Apibacter adventoris]